LKKIAFDLIAIEANGAMRR